MNGPRKPGDYPDRDIDCQEDLAAKLIEALDEAEGAGWNRMEAAKAIVEAAIAIHMGERGANPEE
jgi:hypothetical protein